MKPAFTNPLHLSGNVTGRKIGLQAGREHGGFGNGIGNEPDPSKEVISKDSSRSNAPEPSDPSIEREGYGIGL
jgi:hypothetical protein